MSRKTALHGKTVLLRKTSLVDYPPYLSAVIFFPGCNLRCPWCHNRELVLDSAVPGGIALEDALSRIEKRRGVLGGVTLSGGEPTLFPGLKETTRRIKALGLKLKLDTNGMRPDVLAALLDDEKTRPDFIAMDLKCAPERYAELLPAGVSGAADPGGAVKESAALIRRSGIAHEFRSLALPPAPHNKNGIIPAPYFGASDIAALKPLAGDSPWHIRPFVPGNCLDPAWNVVVAVPEFDLPPNVIV
jgi:pyruvate formate lyase activating enzyme